ILFLLTPGFTDAARDSNGTTYYCPDCAFLEGVLHYHPELRERLDIRYIGFEKPRGEIVKLVGEARQGCPNLVLDPNHHGAPAAQRFHRAGDRLHSDDTRVIVDYLAEQYGVTVAHF
ncbi:MAG: DUF3088 family protein, partial [Planctomycetota bacterium]